MKEFFKKKQSFRNKKNDVDIAGRLYPHNAVNCK